MKILRVRDVWQGKWISQRIAVYEDNHGNEREWEYVVRNTAEYAVSCVARFRPSGDILLVRQFRIALNRPVIGFPAGLVDSGEDVAACALRELREETGYSGTYLRRGPDIASNSGLFSSVSTTVEIDIDERTQGVPERQILDESERIDVIRVPFAAARDFLVAEAEKGAIIGGGPWYYLGVER